MYGITHLNRLDKLIICNSFSLQYRQIFETLWDLYSQKTPRKKPDKGYNKIETKTNYYQNDGKKKMKKKLIIQTTSCVTMVEAVYGCQWNGQIVDLTDDKSIRNFEV